MKKALPIDENLLARYLGGVASEQEKLALEEWLAEDTENILELDQYRKIWDLSENKSDVYKSDVEAAWHKVSERINGNKIPQKTKLIPFFTKFRIAASIAFLLMIWTYFLVLKQPKYEQLLSTNETIEKYLADSSKVFLNHHTLLQFPESFSRNERKVKLRGEAFFDIKPNPDKPFIIDVNDLNIKVLGTSFNVIADSMKVIVTVKTGKVRVEKSESEFVILTPGQEIVYDRNTVSFSKNLKADKNTFAYFNKSFSFKNNDLFEITTALNKAYHTTIIVEDEVLLGLKLTTKFENEKLENILPIIAETLQIELKKQGEFYVFSKKSNQP